MKLPFRNSQAKDSKSFADDERRHELAAIYGSMAIIEFDLIGTIVFANDRFLKVTGCALEEIRGQHHRLFVDPAYSSSTDYQTFWDTLRSGEHVSGQFPRRGKAGKALWLQAEYNPILDDHGKPSLQGHQVCS